MYLSCWFLASSVVKVTLSVQPRFLFRHLKRFLLLPALRLVGVSEAEVGEAAAGEPDAKARLSPGALGALLAGDRSCEGAAVCGELGDAPLPLPPLLGLEGEDRRIEIFLFLLPVFLEWSTLAARVFALVFSITGKMLTFLRPFGSFLVFQVKHFLKAGSGYTLGSLEKRTLSI